LIQKITARKKRKQQKPKEATEKKRKQQKQKEATKKKKARRSRLLQYNYILIVITRL